LIVRGAHASARASMPPESLREWMARTAVDDATKAPPRPEGNSRPSNLVGNGKRAACGRARPQHGTRRPADIAD
jgi:hypothetical protein